MIVRVLIMLMPSIRPDYLYETEHWASRDTPDHLVQPQTPVGAARHWQFRHAVPTAGLPAIRPKMQKAQPRWLG